ncbi:MAG: alpha-L-fucosidase, partial [Chloroflexi bacterium]
IYGTRPWMVYGEGPSTKNTEKIWDSEQVAYTPQDIRFTQKGKDLFAFLLAWPEEGQALIQSLKAGSMVPAEQIQAVRLLGAAGELTWHQDGWGLHIQMPVQKPCENAYTLRIERK